MRIIRGYPPNYDRLCAAFPVIKSIPSVIFSWGNRIYNPSGWPITASLMAHEAVHGGRQMNDMMAWWDRYIKEPEFRLREEVLAHRAEYLHLIAGASRQVRRRSLRLIAKRLKHPMYGGLVNLQQAIKLIKME